MNIDKGRLAMGSKVSFKRPDSSTVDGYLAEPALAEGAPAVVVIQEWWGVNDQIRGVADRLAAAGYLALVPDLYRGKSTVESEEAHHLMSGLNFGDAASQSRRHDWKAASQSPIRPFQAKSSQTARYAIQIVAEVARRPTCASTISGLTTGE